MRTFGALPACECGGVGGFLNGLAKGVAAGAVVDFGFLLFVCSIGLFGYGLGVDVGCKRENVEGGDGV